jgi:hypothetical protein
MSKIKSVLGVGAVILMLASTAFAQYAPWPSPFPPAPAWGDYDAGHVWRDGAWWWQNQPDWVPQHHPEWWGDFDEAHLWHPCAPQNYSGGGQGPRIVKGFASGEVQARTAGNRAVAVLLLGSAVRSCLIVNPVLLRVGHSAATGNRARRSGLVERAGKRTVAEGLGSVAAPSRIPLINDHLYRHPQIQMELCLRKTPSRVRFGPRWVPCDEMHELSRTPTIPDRANQFGLVCGELLISPESAIRHTHGG